jgi:hypothetical protein
VEEAEGKRPVGRTKHRWEDNIKIVLIKIGWSGKIRIFLAQDRNEWEVLLAR